MEFNVMICVDVRMYLYTNTLGKFSVVMGFCENEALFAFPYAAW